MKDRNITVLFLSCICLFYSAVYPALCLARTSEPIKITFINPGELLPIQTGPFWRNVSAYMQAAADDLTIDLTILYAQRDHLLMAKLVDSVLAEKPDYLILVNEKGVVEPLLSKANAANISTFLLLNCLTTNPKQSPYKLWLGCISPNNQHAGFQLASTLINMGLATTPEHKLKMLALVGDHTSQASRERVAGLHNALEKYHDKVELVQKETAMWSQADGHRISYAYLSRNKEIDLIWAANDPIAKGAIMAAQKVGYRPFEDIFIGGINWDAKDNHYPDQYLSFGGHMTLGGFSLVLLYDHFHHQRELRNNIVLEIFSSNKQTVYHRLTHLLSNKQLGNLDYRLFSQHLHKEPLEMTLDNLAASAAPNAEPVILIED